MTIVESIVHGLHNQDLAPVVHYLSTNDSDVAKAVESVLVSEDKPVPLYDAMLAVAFCKKKGKEIFTPQVNIMYSEFVKGLQGSSGAYIKSSV